MRLYLIIAAAVAFLLTVFLYLTGALANGNLVVGIIAAIVGGLLWPVLLAAFGVSSITAFINSLKG